MEWVAGVDVGNNSTEIALARLTGDGAVEIVSSAMVRTVGIKGTSRNALGVIEGLDLALGRAGMTRRAPPNNCGRNRSDRMSC